MKRAELHARIAETIEGAFSEKAESEPEMLAHHFTQAGILDKGVE